MDEARNEEPPNVIPALICHWRLERRIGSGSQGQVWQARSRVQHDRVAAVKLLSECRDARAEVAAHEQLRKCTEHPNILAIRFAVLDTKSINLGFDLCKTDMLEHVLNSRRLGEIEASRWTRQLAAAVSHLHACDIVHLDVKLENAFINHYGQLVLGDLGLSSISPAGTILKKTCGSGVYAAPEVLLCKRLGAYDGRAADVWSVGICSFVMTSGRFPFHVSHPMSRFVARRNELAEAVRTAKPLAPAAKVLSTPTQREETFSRMHLVLLDACLALDPSSRPLASELGGFDWLDETKLKPAYCADVAQEAAVAPYDASLHVDDTPMEIGVIVPGVGCTFDRSALTYDSSNDSTSSGDQAVSQDEPKKKKTQDAYSTPENSPKLEMRKLTSPKMSRLAEDHIKAAVMASASPTFGWRRSRMATKRPVCDLKVDHEAPPSKMATKPRKSPLSATAPF